MLATVNHPNIAAVYGLEKTDDLITPAVSPPAPLRHAMVTLKGDLNRAERHT